MIHKYFVIYTFLSLLWMTAWAQNPAPTEVNKLWAMHYLFTATDEEINQAITDLVLSSDGSAKFRFPMGILYAHRYLRYAQKGDANGAYSNLEKIITPDSEVLEKVYWAMANSFIARIRAMTGMENLEMMDKVFSSIAVDYPDWFIRYLRGITLMEMGETLSTYWKMGEIKKKALNMGRRDLYYVLAHGKRNSIAVFDWRTYDQEVNPVPEIALEKVRELLRQ